MLIAALEFTLRRSREIFPRTLYAHACRGVRPSSGIARSKPDGTRWRREGKWRGKMRMEWVASSLALYVGTRSIQSLSADPHSSTASSRLNWHPRRFKWTRPFRSKTKSGFCACAITFRTCYTWLSTYSEKRSQDPSVDSESFVLYLKPHVALRTLSI